MELTPELMQIQQMVQKLLQLIMGVLSIKHLVMEGHLGNNNAVQMVWQYSYGLESRLVRSYGLYNWLAILTSSVFPATFYSGDALGTFNS